MTSKLRMVILPLYTALMGTLLEYCVQLRNLQHKEDITCWNNSIREILI